jgi:hypothetical protein
LLLLHEGRSGVGPRADSNFSGRCAKVGGMQHEGQQLPHRHQKWFQAWHHDMRCTVTGGALDVRLLILSAAQPTNTTASAYWMEMRTAHLDPFFTSDGRYHCIRYCMYKKVTQRDFSVLERHPHKLLQHSIDMCKPDLSPKRPWLSLAPLSGIGQSPSGQPATAATTSPQPTSARPHLPQICHVPPQREKSVELDELRRLCPKGLPIEGDKGDSDEDRLCLSA